MKHITSIARRAGRFFRILTIGVSLSTASAAVAGDLEVKSPWVALAPPGAQATAAFMELHNPGEKAVDVVSADADGFRSVELHRSINENGMHRMIRQERITVPAGGSVSLAPGGYHVMLIGIERKLEEGDVVTIELTRGDGRRLSVDAPVKRRSQVTSGHGH